MAGETNGRWERDLKKYLRDLIEHLNRVEAAEKMAYTAGW